MIDPADKTEVKPTAEAETNPASANVPVLSPEEQMERFEEDLKESDWGHQPC
jgi:hypothetical protein